MPKGKQVVWMAALVPTIGASDYDGIRLSVFASELDAYRDLNAWLEDMHDEGSPYADTAPGFIADVQDRLNSSDYVATWNIERREVS